MGPARAERDSTGAIPGPLQGFFRSLDDARLRWCLLRPAATLAEAEGDIDVLVDRSDLGTVRALAAEHGFARVPIRGADLHAARYDPDSDRFLWLHVQSEVRIGSGSIPATTVLENAAGGRLADAWLLWIVLLHDVIDKGEVPARHHGHLARLGNAPPPPKLAEIALAHGQQPARLAAAVRGTDWQALRTTVTRPRLRRSPRSIWTWRGAAVAVLGPDGAGKTTLIEGLRATLPFPTRVIYMGLTGGRLPRADALRVPGLVLVARLALLWARYGLGMYHRARGRIVLFDRYTLDGRVPSGVKLRPLARLSRRLQSRAIPAPDLVLLLDASGAAMHARKGEYDPDELESWRAAYARLRSLGHVVVLDAEQPADTVRRQAAARVWECYATRWWSPPPPA